MASAEGWQRSLKGLSEVAFRERFGTEEGCRTALFEMRWREGLTCPACSHHGLRALKTRQLFQCNRCKKQVRLTAVSRRSATATGEGRPGWRAAPGAPRTERRSYTLPTRRSTQRNQLKSLNVNLIIRDVHPAPG